MVFLGILLAAAAVGVGVGIVSENSSSASLSLLDHPVPAVSTDAHVFLAGSAVALCAIAGLAMATRSLRRSAQARRELRDLREERDDSLSTLVMQNERLQREVNRLNGGAGNVQTQSDVPVPPRQRQDRDPVSPFFDRSS